MLLRCEKCESKNYIIIFFLVLLMLGSMVFGSFINKYRLLKNQCWYLEGELKTCRAEIEDFERRVGYFDQRIERLLHEKIELTEEIVELQYKLEEFTTDPMSWIRDNYEKYNCEVTAYSPSVDECDDTPFIAASGREVDDWTIAVSQNMRKDGWNFGDFIYIPDHNKFYKINDVMNRRYTKRVDIFRWTKKEARDFGFCELDMYLIN